MSIIPRTRLQHKPFDISCYTILSRRPYWSMHRAHRPLYTVPSHSRHIVLQRENLSPTQMITNLLWCDVSTKPLFIVCVLPLWQLLLCFWKDKMSEAFLNSKSRDEPSTWQNETTEALERECRGRWENRSRRLINCNIIKTPQRGVSIKKHEKLEWLICNFDR